MEGGGLGILFSNFALLLHRPEGANFLLKVISKMTRMHEPGSVVDNTVQSRSL